MGFNRELLKKKTATTAASLEQKEQEHAALRPRGGFDGGYHKIEEGENIFRIFPFHPDTGATTYAEAKTISWLETSVPKRDKDGKPIEGETEIKRRPIFNAKVHGGLPYDPVSMYMDVAKQKAIPAFTDDEKLAAKIWGKIVGNKIESGIRPQDTWVVYAAKAIGVDDNGNRKWGPIKRLELKKTIKDKMQERAAELGMPDPYSDIDEGIPVIITKAEKPSGNVTLKADEWYKVKLDSRSVKEGNAFVTRTVCEPLTDQQLEEWSKLTPLYKLFVNSYTRKDFEAQLEGLQNFEQQLSAKGWNIDVFAYEEFQQAIATINDLVRDAKEEDESVEEAEEQEVTDEVEEPKVVVKEEPRPLKPIKPKALDSILKKTEVEKPKAEVQIDAKSRIDEIMKRARKNGK